MKRGAAGAVAALVAEVARASSRSGAVRVLLLDLDGTLAPIAATPEEARVPRGTLEALVGLTRRGWRVAVVSGRPAAEVRRLVPLSVVRVFGSHGAENPRRGSVVPAIPRPVVVRLEALSVLALGLSAGVPGSRVERKPVGLALHDRNVAPGDLRRWRRGVERLLRTGDLRGLETLRGRRVVEIRVRGHHKGAVVRELLPGLPGRLDRSLVAFGDDRTDEDLFEAIRGKGLAVRVGPRGMATRAVRRLASPRSVERFLRGLTAITDGGGTR
jgi:trehalose-phosphatase